MCPKHKITNADLKNNIESQLTSHTYKKKLDGRNVSACFLQKTHSRTFNSPCLETIPEHSHSLR